MQKEKKEISNEKFRIEEDSTLGARRNRFQRFSDKARIFFHYQVPLSENNLKSWITSFRGVLIMICLGLIIAMPFFLNLYVYFNILTVAAIYAIFAASWDLLAGVTGQVSFGHAAFFGIGAYCCVILIDLFMRFGYGFNLIVILLLSGIITAGLGLLIAIPSLRLRGPYLALGTLAFSVILYNWFQFTDYNTLTLFGVNYNLRNIALNQKVKIAIFSSRESVFLISILIMIICIVILLAIYNSKLGTIFKGIRDDEPAIKASGINTWKYKLISFSISAFFAGIAGVLFALITGQASFDLLGTTYSFYPVVFSILGGIASISGAVLGAFVFIILQQLIIEFLPNVLLLIPFINPDLLVTYIATISLLIFAIILIIIIRFTKHGIMEPIVNNAKILWELVLGK